MNSIIDKLGCSYIKNSFNPLNNYFSLLQTRVRDQFIQDWRSSISSMSKLTYFCQFKTDFTIAKYITLLDSDRLIRQLASFRLSSHSLEIETGRRLNIPKENRICKCCNLNQIESEYHFLLCCPTYSTIRNVHLGRISWPSIGKFNAIMSSNSKKNISKTALFIKEAFKKRKETLQ